MLGVALTNVQNGYNLIQSIFAGFGTAVGYTVAIVLLAAGAALLVLYKKKSLY